mmetsp:Transcript_20951/g.83491  ORF Transcript_20951/g.83491 Transcript_20951/m.83491 type:complete len:254 (-) Transcript_20951:1807-2568(-)
MVSSLVPAAAAALAVVVSHRPATALVVGVGRPQIMRPSVAVSATVERATADDTLAGASGAKAYEIATTCLTGHASAEACSLETLEAAYRVLDSEVIRSECSAAQQRDVDELWRVIKLCYNGASVADAVAARGVPRFASSSAARDDGAPAKETAASPDAAFRGESGAEAYQRTLLCLDPHNGESCDLDELEAAFAVLDHEKIRAEASPAQTQVIDQLWRAIKACYDGRAVDDAVKHTWAQRDGASRDRLYYSAT